MDKNKSGMAMTPYICEPCDGTGKVKKVMKRRGAIGTTDCRKCQGTGYFATGVQIDALFAKNKELRDANKPEEITHVTESQDAITVKFNPTGIEVSATTGDLYILAISERVLAIAAKPHPGSVQEMIKNAD